MEEKQNNAKWQKIIPCVNNSKEFLEITNDFGEPLEIIREAISNSIDWDAKQIWISIYVDVFEGIKKLFICFEDDGDGMTKDVISKDFWGLGFSNSKNNPEKIGEKGHGTKIFLRSQKVTVATSGPEGCFMSFCDKPLAALAESKLHEPFVREVENLAENDLKFKSGTKITIIGYNDDARSKFIQSIVKDYILWFTKIGSIEKVFGINRNNDVRVFLKCLDVDEFEEIEFGHVFPEKNADINKLFDEFGSDAADYYVKRYIYHGSLKKFPEVKYESFYSIEGDLIKRKYNPMIKSRTKESQGTYRVSDRYGLWLCKDFIPITRQIDWISNFGSGSNAYLMIHGFVNCQSLMLTANRGDIANTDPEILEELEEEIKKEIRLIDIDLKNDGIYFLRDQQQVEKTIEQEKAEYFRRIKDIERTKKQSYKNFEFLEPKNESEVFGFFIQLFALASELFDFIPKDYNTSRGIDIIAKNKRADGIIENEYGYIELKHTLKTDFNHAFQYLKWIICWDFSSSINEDTEFIGIRGNEDRRYLRTVVDEKGNKLYFLEGKGNTNRIQVIRLKEFVDTNLKLEYFKEK